MINNSDLKLFAPYEGAEFENTKKIHDRILILGGHHPCLPYNRKNKYGVDCPPNKDLKDCLKDDNCPAYEGKCPLYENCNDNDRKNDLHTAPFLSTLDNDDAMRGLVDVGFEGPFTFEATSKIQHRLRKFEKLHGQNGASLPVARAYEKALYETGKYLLSTYNVFED